MDRPKELFDLAEGDAREAATRFTYGVAALLAVIAILYIVSLFTATA
jgi:hypothetical protein